MGAERTKDITKEDLPYQVMGKYFGATSDREALTKWRDIVKNNQDWLAKMAGVAVYDGKVNNGEQNGIIADKLRSNTVLPFYDYAENAEKIDNFDDVKKIITNKNLLKQRTMEFYIANLNNDQIGKLNMLSPMQKAFFIAGECERVDVGQGKIQEKVQIGGNVENKNLAVMKELENRVDNMNAFLVKYGMTEYVLNKKTKTFANQEMEQGYQEYISKGLGADAYKKMKAENKNTDNIELLVRGAYMQKKMYASEKYANLNSDAKEELANMTVEYYTITQKMQINLDDFGLGDVYTKAREYLTQWYGNNEKEPCHTLISNINTDSDMQTFFTQEENQITKLSPTATDKDILKDKAYYKKLFILYPTANVGISDKNVDDYLEYFDNDMSIKDGISEAEKKDAEGILAKIQEVTKPYEEKLLTKTTTVVQEYAINQCIESLQSYMDIDVSKQNLSEQLTILTDDNAVANENGELLFKIQGERDGKKLTLSYDLISGKVYHHPFLYKASLNDADPLTVGEKNGRNKLPLANLPSMSKIIAGAQEADYMPLMNAAETLDDYTKNVQENMDESLVFNKDISYELGQDTLQKQVIKDEIVQNVMKCSGRTMSPSEEITTQYQSMYGFYNNIYKSLEYYSMKSVDQLELFNKNIQKLLEYRDKKITIEEIAKYKEDKENPIGTQNEEKFALQSLVHQSSIPQITTTFTDQGPEKKLKLFFDCFNKEVGGINIIDIDMMEDYFIAADGTNTKENKVEKWSRNAAFTKLIDNVDTKRLQDQASIDLDRQLEMA